MRTSHKLAFLGLLIILLISISSYFGAHHWLSADEAGQVSLAANTTSEQPSPVNENTKKANATSADVIESTTKLEQIVVPTVKLEVASQPVSELASTTTSETKMAASTETTPVEIKSTTEDQLLAGVADPYAPSERELEAWRQFKHTYGRAYTSEQEELHRQAIFLANLKFINNFNQQQKALFTLAVNKFADLTRDETNQIFVGPMVSWSQTMAQMQVPEPRPIRVLSSNGLSETGEPSERPTKLKTVIDMRNMLGAPVDQGKCLDSSVYAAVAALEAARTTSSGGLAPQTKLSEYHLLDCLAIRPQPQAPTCSGFNSMLSVFEQLSRTPLVSQETYAELKRKFAGQPVCQVPVNETIPMTRLSHYTTLHSDNIPGALSDGGPLVVAFDASQPTFHFYSSGIYHELNCFPDHYNVHALLVGYGHQFEGDTQNEAYLARMSFGPYWGESGHVWLLRDPQRNKCQPQHVAILPHVTPEL